MEHRLCGTILSLAATGATEVELNLASVALTMALLFAGADKDVAKEPSTCIAISSPWVTATDFSLGFLAAFHGPW